MSPAIKNVLAVAAGIIIGSGVNIGLVVLGQILIPLPDVMDGMDANSIGENAHLLEVKHMIPAFFAHAMGTLVGAFVAARFSVLRKLTMALLIGVFFLYGGIQMSLMVPAPTWFDILDLGFAYIPMAYAGYWLATGSKK